MRELTKSTRAFAARGGANDELSRRAFLRSAQAFGWPFLLTASAYAAFTVPEQVSLPALWNYDKSVSSSFVHQIQVLSQCGRFG